MRRLPDAGTIAIDFLTVPTVTFNIVYVFFVLSLERRRVLHVNVTAHPYAAWAAQQIVEAIGANFLPTHLIRDRDGIYGAAFHARVDHLGIAQGQDRGALPLAKRIRRKMARHTTPQGDAPVARAVEPTSAGKVVALSRVGSLHHRYSRAA
jgi:predicted Rdx family selenoprotein